MLPNGRFNLLTALYVLLFVAAIFAVVYFSFWTEDGTVARKPIPSSYGSPAAPQKTGN